MGYFNFKGALNATFLNTYLKPQLSLIMSSAPGSAYPNVSIYDASDATLKHGIYPIGSSTASWKTIGKVGAWLSYTPTWSTSGTAPSLGNGTLTGYYNVFYRRYGVVLFSFVAGSTTTFGTGTWSFTLPSALDPSSIYANVQGAGQAVDVSAGYYFLAQDQGYLRSAGKATPWATQSSSSFSARKVTSTIPFTWATSDQLTMSYLIDIDSRT